MARRSSSTFGLMLVVDGVPFSALAGAVSLMAWTPGTLLGVLLGGAIRHPEDLGLDAAFPVFFLVVLVDQGRTRDTVTVAVAGAAVALLLTPGRPRDCR